MKHCSFLAAGMWSPAMGEKKYIKLNIITAATNNYRWSMRFIQAHTDSAITALDRTSRSELWPIIEVLHVEKYKTKDDVYKLPERWCQNQPT